MRIETSGAVVGTPIVPLAEAEAGFLDRVAEADGSPEFSGGLMAIATGEDTSHEAQTASSVWRVYDEDDTLIGFGIRALQGERHAAEFLIAPGQRRRGLGGQLLAAILEEQPASWCWAHGDHPGAQALAARHGLGRDRVLFQMSTADGLGLDELPDTTTPEDVTIRSFAPGDEEGWLQVNNAAFDWHPEQGSQTRADIDAIVTAADFDPSSVVIAERAGRIIGFHETKLTDPGDDPAAGPGTETAPTTGTSGRLGEVYVVGVDPAVHAKGVGKALTVEGMRRMVAAGAGRIELYVESDNAPALGLYERLGFHVAVAHVSYAPASSTEPTQE